MEYRYFGNSDLVWPFEVRTEAGRRQEPVSAQGGSSSLFGLISSELTQDDSIIATEMTKQEEKLRREEKPSSGGSHKYLLEGVTVY